MDEKKTAAKVKAIAEDEKKIIALLQSDKTKYIEIKGGYKFVPVFDMPVLKKLEPLIGDMNVWEDKLNDPVTGVDTLVTILTAMLNEGLAQQGIEPAITEEWLLMQLIPSQKTLYRLALRRAFVEGNRTETKGEKVKRDKVLERIKKGAVTEV